MHLKHLILCLLFLGLVKSSNEDTLTWNESHKLNWADFKASPNQNSDAVALTASGITFGYSLKTSGERIIDFSTSVEAHFYPNKSWYLKDRGSTDILAYEQLHFDMSELYARKFREQLKKIVVNQNTKQQMQRLYTVINKGLYKTQKRYDSQSSHSMDIDAQKEWKVFIQEELEKSDKYKSQ
jgi:hypothetical protein